MDDEPGVLHQLPRGVDDPNSHGFVRARRDQMVHGHL